MQTFPLFNSQKPTKNGKPRLPILLLVPLHLPPRLLHYLSQMGSQDATRSFKLPHLHLPRHPGGAPLRRGHSLS